MGGHYDDRREPETFMLRIHYQLSELMVVFQSRLFFYKSALEKLKLLEEDDDEEEELDDR